MYIMMEENRDLKEELEGFKNISYEVWMKKLVDENKYLSKRVGELLGQLEDLEEVTDKSTEE